MQGIARHQRFPTGKSIISLGKASHKYKKGFLL
nr:MAG TPA: hypothetical protein [Caudoviricetes sp.]